METKDKIVKLSKACPMGEETKICPLSSFRLLTKAEIRKFENEKLLNELLELHYECCIDRIMKEKI
jgi:hypothetical protein